MKNLKREIRIALFLLAIGSPIFVGFAQTSKPSATPVSQADYNRVVDEATRGLLQGCASAIEEIKAGRAYIKQLEAVRDNQAAEIVALKEKVSTLETANAARAKESEALRASLDASTKAINEATSALKVSIARNEKLEKQVKFWRKAGIGGVLTSAALIALKFVAF